MTKTVVVTVEYRESVCALRRWYREMATVSPNKGSGLVLKLVEPLSS